MRSRILIPLLALLFVAIQLPAQPQPSHRPGPVPQGIRKGAITPGEARHLRHKRAHLRREMRMARANDGRIGPAERRHLRKEVRQYKRHRHWALHNRRTR